MFDVEIGMKWNSTYNQLKEKYDKLFIYTQERDEKYVDIIIELNKLKKDYELLQEDYNNLHDVTFNSMYKDYTELSAIHAISIKNYKELNDKYIKVCSELKDMYMFYEDHIKKLN